MSHTVATRIGLLVDFLGVISRLIDTSRLTVTRYVIATGDRA